MNVFVYAGSLAHTQAGAAHATLDFANALAANTDHAVYVYATEYDPGTLHPRVEIIRYRRPDRLPVIWRMRHLTDVRQQLNELRRYRLPAVDLCYTQGLVWGMAFRRLRPEVPIISHTGAVISERERIEELGGANSPWTVRADAKLLTRMERRSYREPRWAHVVSTRSVARQRAAFYDVDEAIFNIAPYGLSVDKFNREALHEDMRTALGIPADAVVLITVSRLIKWKNTDMLLRAFSRCAPDRAYLIVAGDGAERQRLESLARHVGVASRVRFAGHVANPAPYYAAADLFALPSQIESFGIVYGEAMLMGLPCIGLRNSPPTVLSSAEDVLVHGTTGFCVDDEEDLVRRLTELFSDQDLRRRMGEAGRQRATSLYSCQAYVDSMMALARVRFGCDC